MGASPGAQLARTEVQKNRRPKSTNCTTLHYDDDDDDQKGSSSGRGCSWFLWPPRDLIYSLQGVKFFKIGKTKVVLFKK